MFKQPCSHLMEAGRWKLECLAGGQLSISQLVLAIKAKVKSVSHV